MSDHLLEVTTRLDARGIGQTVVTARRHGAPKWQPLGIHSEVFRLGGAASWVHRSYLVMATTALARMANRADVVHVHVREELAILALAGHVARRRGLPLVVTAHGRLPRDVNAVDVRSAFFGRVAAAVKGGLLPRADAVIEPGNVDLEETNIFVVGGRCHGWDQVADRVAAAYEEVIAAGHPTLRSIQTEFV